MSDAKHCRLLVQFHHFSGVDCEITPCQNRDSRSVSLSGQVSQLSFTKAPKMRSSRRSVAAFSLPGFLASDS